MEGGEALRRDLGSAIVNHSSTRVHALSGPLRVFGTEYRQPKQYLAGTHRACTPAETLERMLPLLPRFGITRLANITGLDYLGVPVYQAIRPNSRTLSLSQGKGLDKDSAKVSALMESVDAWHAEAVSAPTAYASVREFASRHTVVDLDSLPRLYGVRVNEWTVLPWVEGWDLIGQRPIWVPHDLVNLNRVERDQRRQPFFPSNSAGLASGNHVLEAINHGLAELIEHDANALWRLGPGDADGVDRLIDHQSISDPQIQTLLGLFLSAGLSLAVADITSDLGVPCFWSMAIEPPEAMLQIGYAWGQGCHPSARVAICRALTEAAQSRLTFIAGSRDDIDYSHYEHMSNPVVINRLRSLVEKAEPALRFEERPGTTRETLEGDLALMLGRLVDAGIEHAIVVDLSRREVGVPVVKMIVPGLEPVVLDASTHIPGRRLAAVRARGGVRR